MDTKAEVNNPSPMPAFKRGDLVRSRVALPVSRTATAKSHFVVDKHDPATYHNQPIPLDSSSVQNLPVQAGTVFEVDAVLPWQDLDETEDSRYRLALNDHYFDALRDTDQAITQKEFFGLNTILDEEHTLPMYAFADEAVLELVSADDNRVPGENLLEAWSGDDYFPWTIQVEFPDADQLLCYEIDSWLCDDASAAEDELGYSFALRPLYVGTVPILLLSIKPGQALGYDTPHIDFFSERLAMFSCDEDSQTITLRLQFSIMIDLDNRTWRFA